MNKFEDIPVSGAISLFWYPQTHGKITINVRKLKRHVKKNYTFIKCYIKNFTEQQSLSIQKMSQGIQK